MARIGDLPFPRIDPKNPKDRPKCGYGVGCRRPAEYNDRGTPMCRTCGVQAALGVRGRSETDSPAQKYSRERTQAVRARRVPHATDGECGCACGGKPKGAKANFLPGHDMSAKRQWKEHSEWEDQ